MSRREQLIIECMPLVQAVVKKRVRQCEALRYLADDMVSAGYVGAIEAIDTLLAADAEVVVNQDIYIVSSIKYAIAKLIDEDPIIGPSYRTRIRRRKSGVDTVLKQVEVENVDLIPAPSSNVASMRNDIFESCDSLRQLLIIMARESNYTDAEIGESLGVTRQAISKAVQPVKQRYLSDPLPQRLPAVKLRACRVAPIGVYRWNQSVSI